MNKATRDAFGDQLIESAKDNKNIIVLSADLAKATKIDRFAKLYPERFFEVGIAENNMIGIASGLSEYNHKVFIASFASFLTGKYDTIRCSLAYSNCPVVIIGTHGGLAIGKDGVTQMGLEDISIMRSLPNMTIYNPATYNETKSLIKYICDNPIDGPVYIRLGRQPVQEVYLDTYEYYTPNAVNGINIIKNYDNNCVVFSTGCVLPDVLNAIKDIDVDVINITQLKPISSLTRQIIEFLIRKHKYIFTVEDHSVVGGLGSIIAEIMAEIQNDAILKRIGINDVFPESGKPEDLYEKYGLSESKIKNTILNFINENK